MSLLLNPYGQLPRTVLSTLRLFTALSVAVFIAHSTAAVNAQPSPCTSIHVAGMAYVLGSADTSRVDAGRTIYHSDTLRFTSKDDRLVVLCPDAGRVVLRPAAQSLRAAPQTTPSGRPLLLALVEQAIAPPSGPTPLSTRGPLAVNPVDSLADITDVQRHFGVGRYLVIDSLAIRLSEASPLVEALARGSALAIHIIHSSEEQEITDARWPRLGHPIPFRMREGVLFLSRDSLPVAHGRSPLTAALYYYEKGIPAWDDFEDGEEALDEGRRVTTVRLVHPPALLLQRETSVLAITLREGGTNPTQVRHEVASFLHDVYGTPYLPHLDALLARIAESE